MLRFLPAAILSLLLWAIGLHTAYLAFASIHTFFGSVGGLVSLAFFL